MIVEVLLPVPLSKTFDYELGDYTVVTGQRVAVPFGTSKIQVGIVIAVREVVDEEPLQPLKMIIGVLDDFPIIDEHWLNLIRFASRYYAEPLGKAFKNALPTRLRQQDALVLPYCRYFSLTELGQQTIDEDGLPKRSTRLRRLLQLFNNATCIDETTLRQQSVSKADQDKALTKGFISVEYRSPYDDNSPVVEASYVLNEQQQSVVDAVIPQLDSYQAHLLYGVTGSGKTEVYIHLINAILAQGKQVLLLVPEIGLTPQMLSRFTKRFGRRVAAYHSGLTDVARRDVFLAAQTGELPVLIGTRSSVFLPMPNLGLILVDEEHDVSYKQQEGFLYHARDLAVWRAKQLGINILLGSATPSLESIDNVKQGKFQRHILTHRATAAALPTIQLVDRRGHGRSQVLADRVMQKMRQVLQNGKQVLLFLNRRGFAPVMMCDACGWSSDCPTCSVYQTAHVSMRQLCCHHCGHIESLPTQCPDCGSSDLYFAGAGTEKLEAQLSQQFPQQRILRLDRDKQTTAKQLDEALQCIYAGEVDIILGTQLVVKGHHFPQVDMVCVVDADSALFSSDFRAEEHLYQQLIQVAGRAGRASHVGHVDIQSCVPDHPVFHALIRHDYWSYAEHLLAERESHALPPHTARVLIKASALDKSLLLDYLRAVRQSLLDNIDDCDVFGPVPLAVERVKNRYQAQLWLSAPDRLVIQKSLPLVQQVVRHFDGTNRFKTIIDVDAV